MDQVEVANYRITGLVDKFDEQMNIIGQFEIGSVQELPVEVGTKLVADGRAEAVGTEEEAGTEEAPAESNEGASGATGTENTEELGASGATGATGGDNDDDDNNDDEVV